MQKIPPDRRVDFCACSRVGRLPEMRDVRISLFSPLPDCKLRILLVWVGGSQKMLGRFRNAHAKPLLRQDKIRILSCLADIRFPGYQPIPLYPVFP